MTEVVRVRILPASDVDASLWRLTHQVGHILEPLAWVLIGGQMVAILEAEHGATIGFATGDVVALLDVRAVVGVTDVGHPGWRRVAGAPDGRCSVGLPDRHRLTV